jgi:hypothetical protein
MILPDHDALVVTAVVLPELELPEDDDVVPELEDAVAFAVVAFVAVAFAVVA